MTKSKKSNKENAEQQAATGTLLNNARESTTQTELFVSKASNPKENVLRERVGEENSDESNEDRRCVRLGKERKEKKQNAQWPEGDKRPSSSCLCLSELLSSTTGGLIFTVSPITRTWAAGGLVWKSNRATNNWSLLQQISQKSLILCRSLHFHLVTVIVLIATRSGY